MLVCLFSSADCKLNIELDYLDSSLVWGKGRGDDTAKYIMMLKTSLSVVDYFSKTLSLRTQAMNPLPVIIKGFRTPLNGVVVKSKSITNGLYIYFDAFSSTDEQFDITSYGQIHQVDLTTGRPIAASLSVNLQITANTASSLYKYFTIVSFDVFKIIGFDKTLFDKFLDLSGTATDGTYAKLAKTSIVQTNTYLTSSRDFVVADQSGQFLTNARQQYRADLPGVILESKGDEYYAGNSWEKAFYPNDFLNPTEELPCLISEFSVSFVFSTGWYQLDTLNHPGFQTVWYGKGNADFQKSTECLPAGDEGSCSTEGQLGCSVDGTFKTECRKEAEYSGDCLYKAGTQYCFINDAPPTKKDFEVYGPASRCVLVNDPANAANQIPACLKVTGTPAGTTVTFTLNDGSVCSCVGAGDVTCGGVTVKCPSTTTFSNRQAAQYQCANDCSANGICLLRSGATTASCYCFYGWTGATCDTASTATGVIGESLDYFTDGIYKLDGSVLSLLTSLILSVGLAMSF